MLNPFLGGHNSSCGRSGNNTTEFPKKKRIAPHIFLLSTLPKCKVDNSMHTSSCLYGKGCFSVVSTLCYPSAGCRGVVKQPSYVGTVLKNWQVWLRTVLEYSKSPSFIDDSVGRWTWFFDTAITTQHNGYTMVAVVYLDVLQLAAVFTSMPGLLLTRSLS